MIGNRIKEERNKLGLSQTEFAAIAKAAKRTQIDWEKGVSSPTAEQLANLAAAGVDAQYIVTGTHSTPVLCVEQERAGYSVAVLSPAEQRALDALRASGALQPSTINQTITAPAGQVAAGNHINQKQGAANVGNQSGGRRRR